MISESIGCKKKKLSKNEVFHLQQKCDRFNWFNVKECTRPLVGPKSFKTPWKLYRGKYTWECRQIIYLQLCLHKECAYLWTSLFPHICDLMQSLWDFRVELHGLEVHEKCHGYLNPYWLLSVYIFHIHVGWTTSESFQAGLPCYIASVIACLTSTRELSANSRDERKKGTTKNNKECQ